ncbi:tripartite tricarboxylate transporter substrate binding protein [Alicyclobacillus macrosporangiidus]|uniref:Bug family tripartite tricarboxylate transporter substrate binding protein n=1 Tax=Alicyclobacillus macrosporangiidus TaxID=392015 RepID=UPI0026EBEF72|nr:tripartite tricarboxylate transporter substrate binding protein [Alicyclobacillus macrosporangiidus]
MTSILAGGLVASVAGCGQAGGSTTGASQTSSNSTAQMPSDHFPNQTITFIVPYAPGGDFDTTARLLAPYLSKYLPNHPNVIVKNVPGGNSVIGDMQVINAKPDGYTIGYFTLPAIALGPLIGQGDYDLTKVSWVGQVFSMPYVAAASTKSGLKSLQDVKADTHLRVGTTGITTTAGLASFIAMKTLGVQNPITVPSGGSSQSVLAAAQGSVDLVQFPYPALKQEISAGLIKPLWVNASQRLSELPDVPTVGELGYPQLASVVSLNGAIGTTPGVPAGHLQVLREALKKALSDPEFVQKMKAANESPAYLDGDATLAEVQQDIQEMQKYAPEIKAQIQK